VALIRSVYPLRAGIRLVGVTLSNFRGDEADLEGQLSFGAPSPLEAQPSTGNMLALDNEP